MLSDIKNGKRGVESYSARNGECCSGPDTIRASSDSISSESRNDLGRNLNTTNTVVSIDSVRNK